MAHFRCLANVSSSSSSLASSFSRSSSTFASRPLFSLSSLSSTQTLPLRSLTSVAAQSQTQSHTAHNPLIRFRYGKRDSTPARNTAGSSSFSSSANSSDWMSGNDAAFSAWMSLPARYKRQIYTPELIDYVQLGGATPDPPKPAVKEGKGGKDAGKKGKKE